MEHRGLAVSRGPSVVNLEFIVMPGLVPGIHVLTVTATKTWMAGSSPAMTKNKIGLQAKEENT